MSRTWPTCDLTLFKSWFVPAWPSIRTCSDDSTLSDYDSTRFDSWFDPVKLMIWPCSIHTSSLCNSEIESVQFIILSSLFDVWFDPAQLMNRPTRFQSCFDLVRQCKLVDTWFDTVQLVNRPCLTHSWPWLARLDFSSNKIFFDSLSVGQKLKIVWLFRPNCEPNIIGKPNLRKYPFKQTNKLRFI